MAGHPHIERWSLLMHRNIAERIAAGDPLPLATARANLQRWAQRNGALSPAQAEWVAILDWPTQRLLTLLCHEDDQEAVRLRGTSPFSGAIDQQLRIELLRESRAA